MGTLLLRILSIDGLIQFLSAKKGNAKPEHLDLCNLFLSFHRLERLKLLSFISVSFHKTCMNTSAKDSAQLMNKTITLNSLYLSRTSPKSNQDLVHSLGIRSLLK